MTSVTDQQSQSQSQSQTTSPNIVKDIFDAAITMPEGSKIPLSFGSESQRESFRVRFYNEKQRYAEAFGMAIADTIICSKHTNTEANEFSLIITKTKPMSTPCIITPDGTVIPVPISKRHAPTSPFPFPSNCPTPPPLSTEDTPVDFGSGPETPEQRRQRLMNVTTNVNITLPDTDEEN